MAGLKDLQGAWDDASDQGFTPIPDGDHVAVIKSAGVEEGDRGISAYFKLYIPKENANETAYFSMSAAAIWALKVSMKNMGLTIKNVLQVPIALAATEGWTVEVNKKTNGKYRNWMIKSTIDRGGEAPEKKEVSKDEIPF